MIGTSLDGLFHLGYDWYACTMARMVCLTLVALDEEVHEPALHGQPDAARQVEQHGL